MIVNTRPADLGQKTNSLLESSHQNFVHIPLTRILETEPPSKTLEYINNLKGYDVLIFTSQSAVIYGRKFYQEAIVANINIPILAIGLATQESLLKFQLTSSTPPTFDSAGLANVIKEMGYKKCLVFCGEQNPRIVTMTDADIDAFPCYASHDEINVDVSKIRNETKLVVLIYTHQSLKVLIKEMPVNENQEAVLIVASRRIEELAKEYGFRKIVLAESPHDKEMVKAALAEV
jgi:uroporphyrinogen-III synthase